MSRREVIFNIQDLMKMLPHRFPFMLLDKVVEVHEASQPPNRVGRKIVAIKNVTINEPFFPGHFPHRPVMPGVLQIEAMAQAGAIAAYRQDEPMHDVAIVSIKNGKFRQPVVPGDTLEIHAQVVKDRGSMISLETYILVEGTKVSEAEIMAKVFPLVPMS